MGSKGKTRKTTHNVIKERGTFGSVAAGNSGGGKPTENNECILSISTKFKLPTNFNTYVGDFSSIVLTNENEVKIIIGNKPVKNYVGSNKSLLIRCIGRGFVYEGQVTSVNNSDVEIKVESHG